MNTSNTLKLLSLAAVCLPLLAQAAGPAHDGWQAVGDSLVYVGTADAGTSREAVRQAARAKPVAGSDGFLQIGDSLVYVGLPSAPSDARVAAQ